MVDSLQIRPQSTVMDELCVGPEMARRRRVVGLDVWLKVGHRAPTPTISTFKFDDRCLQPDYESAGGAWIESRNLIRGFEEFNGAAAFVSVGDESGVRVSPDDVSRRQILLDNRPPVWGHQS